MNASGKKSRAGSIEAPIGRAYPEKEHIKFIRIAIHFLGRGWPSK
jgi:hypothetical protein